MRLMPNTLAGRTIFVLLAGLVVSNLIGLLIYAGERDKALISIAGGAAAERIVAVVQAVKRSSLPARSGVVCGQSGPGLAVMLASQAMVRPETMTWRSRLLATTIQNLLGNSTTGRPRIAIDEPGTNPVAHKAFTAVMGQCMGGMMGMMRKSNSNRMMSGNYGLRGTILLSQTKMPGQMSMLTGGDILRISYPLGKDRWLNFIMLSPRFTPIWRSRFFLAFFVMAIVVTILSVWAVRRSTAPLALFAWAAERLGRDVNAAYLPEDGPREVHRAAKAFNEMQRRLRGLINDRTQMLAAISHDLRTPITRLRLRAEFVDDPEQREKMLTDLEQMEQMIAATLAFAREDNADEPGKTLDLTGLVQSICDDASDMGHDVSCRGIHSASFSGRPLALRRAFTNLVDNALKYGGRLRVNIDVSPKYFVITLEDDGPGIPDDEIERVFEPFYRVETSRSRETGGTGLGLAVVRGVIRGHGGEVTLSNRPEGGLCVTVTLPRT